jgi:hypothetical protein
LICFKVWRASFSSAFADSYFSWLECAARIAAPCLAEEASTACFCYKSLKNLARVTFHAMTLFRRRHGVRTMEDPMFKVEPLINAEDYLAFQAMMPQEPAFKDAPTGVYIDFAAFSCRESIRIQGGTRPDKTVVMVSVQPDKFEQYCANYDKDRNWQSLTNFADAKFDMGLDVADDE